MGELVSKYDTSVCQAQGWLPQVGARSIREGEKGIPVPGQSLSKSWREGASEKDNQSIAGGGEEGSKLESQG